VPRAQQHGIQQGDYAPRARATAEVAGRLGIETPEVKLVTIDGQTGSLTKWIDGSRTLEDLRQFEPQVYQAVVGSKEYQDARAAIATLDYLINNLDRGSNLGNYLVFLNSDGSLARLMPIDGDLTFTSSPERAVIQPYTTGLPKSYSPQMVEHLRHLDANRDTLRAALLPLVGEEAFAGVLHRLDELLADVNRLTGARRQ
jgi:hypothetical protein